MSGGRRAGMVVKGGRGRGTPGSSLALVNAEGRVLTVLDTALALLDGFVQLDRRVLRLPAVTFAELPAPDVPGVLRPAFDVMWNAFGFG